MKMEENQKQELFLLKNYVSEKQTSGDVRWSNKIILRRIKEYANRGYDVNEYQETYWKSWIEYWEFWKTQDDFRMVIKKQFNQHLNDDERRLLLFFKDIVRKIKHYKELDNKLFSLELAKDRWEIL